MPIRIASLASFLPAPADSGSPIRVARLSRGLATLGPVTLYCRATAEDADRLIGHAALAPFATVRVRRHDAGEFAKIARVFTPEALAHWTSPEAELGTALEADHRADPFDVVVAHQVFSAHIASSLRGVPLVLDEHNVESLAAIQAMAAIRSRNPVDSSAVVGAIEAYEAEAWARASRITCPTEADAEQIRRRTATPVRVVPNGVGLEDVPFVAPSHRAGGSILFVGTYHWPPNAKAARFLVKEVLPRVRAVLPEARVVICGKSPGLDVALLRGPGVEVTGTVASVAPYLAGACAYACPLFEGGGSSLKVLEALAAGVPLVATATGVRGYPMAPGRHFLHAEDADGFAEAILAILRDPSAFDPMAIEGRALAEAFTWGRAADSLAEVVAEAAGRSPRHPDAAAP